LPTEKKTFTNLEINMIYETNCAEQTNSYAKYNENEAERRHSMSNAISLVTRYQKHHLEGKAIPAGWNAESTYGDAFDI